MKRLALPAALALTLAAGLAFAQQPMPAQAHHGHHGPRDPHKAALHLGQKLNLSPDQTAKLEPVIAERQQKIQALRADASLTPEQRHQQARALHQQTEKELAGILTPDQLTQLKSMHHGHHGHGAAGEAPAA